MDVGFTGTQEGITEAQRKQLRLCLEMMKLGAGDFPITIHHGSCIGADEQVHLMGFTMGFLRAVHPPTDESKMANCQGEHMYTAKPYLERNRDIAQAGRILIACPKTGYEVQRSGTWATVRYAQELHKPVLVLYPLGEFDWL